MHSTYVLLHTTSKSRVKQSMHTSGAAIFDEIGHNLCLGIVTRLHFQLPADPAELAKPVIRTGIAGSSSSTIVSGVVGRDSGTR